MEQCNCGSVGLVNVNRYACKFNMGQLQLMGLVDTRETVSITKTNAAIKATWTAMMEANDSSSTPDMVITPLVYNPSNTPGEAVTIGGDNSTPDGRTELVGIGNSEFSVDFHGAMPGQIDALNKEHCLAEINSLGAYLFSHDGRVFGIEQSSNILPIPVKYLFVAARALGGLQADDVNTMTFQLGYDWEKSLVGVDLTGGTSGTPWRGADLITASLS